MKISHSILEKCTYCGECERVCSIFLQTGKDSPFEKIEVAKEIFHSSQKPERWETVFLCTKCEACDTICPEEIPITKIVDEARKTCVEKWGIQYPRQKVIIENILKTGNPFGKEESRTSWLEEEIPEKSKTLLHLGCMLSFPNSKMGKNIISVLKKLDIDFTISPNESCCGYFVWNTGNHKIANQIIEQNLKEFQKYERIIVACAGCYTFLKGYYPLKNELKHVIEIITEKLKEKSINIIDSKKIAKKVAIFQDSCHLARPHGVVEPPREVLNKMGYILVEFDLTKDEGLCCGADGGMRIINLPFALKMGKRRLEQALEKNDTLFTLCPFCIHNFRESAEKYGVPIQIKDLFEELNKCL
ncbi:MAG: (Fe-S)-binding protein [Candidatus Helarchaeota archaeon]